MKRFLLYGHGGAYNHGAEAIVKSTVRLLNELYPGSLIILSTHYKEQDIEFGMPVDEYCERNPDGLEDSLVYKSVLDRITGDTICLSVGGDNYSYDNWRKWRIIHETALKCGALSILWSCSIEPSMLTDEMVATLKTHHLITARESLTYQALKDIGLNNVVQCADIAFLLDSIKCKLPNNFVEGNTVAVNVSPLALRRENIGGIVLRNTENLIRYIVENTDMSVALIPHVMMPSDNDLTLLRELHERIPHKGRSCLVSGNLGAAELKYTISKCRFGVFARTHATVAAYSSCVPSISIGYSVKSKGIATDLGLEDYVLPLQNFEDDYSLLSIFNTMARNEQKIKYMLLEAMPSYRAKAEIDPLLFILKG